MKEENIIHPACQFDYTKIPANLDIRCTQCGGKYQSWTIDCPAYTKALQKYLENKKYEKHKTKSKRDV